MNTKNYFLKWAIPGATVAAFLLVFSGNLSHHKKQPRLTVTFAQALAMPPSSNCESMVKDTMNEAPGTGKYANAFLGHLHDQLYRFNKIEAADAEMVLCRIVNRMGMNPDLTNLPQTFSKTDSDGHTVALTVTAPQESWAVSAQYLAKAVLSRDGTTFMTLWWAGDDTSSKGYLIQGANPMMKDGMIRLKYILWDRSSANQSIRIYSTQFVNNYLGSSTEPSEAETGGDQSHYARATFDKSTQTITAQSIGIRVKPHDSQMSCVRTMINGTIGGTISVYRPANGIPEPVTDTYKDGTSLDGVTQVTDSASTSSSSGTVISAPATLPMDFDFSCYDVNAAGGVGGIFANNQVDFTANPSTVFPN